MTAILEAIGLNKKFGAVTAAADITVAIEEGEVVGVIGANGAGKTTFINMVTGYLKPDSGRILFQGKDVTGLGTRLITRRGMHRSFQIPQIFPELTVFENALAAIGMAGRARNAFWSPLETPETVAAADAVLERYGIGDYHDQEAGLLPQGVRKLLDIAMAMAGEPAMLLLDEPTSGISAEEKMSVMDTIMTALSEAGVTVLFVEHDMDVVAKCAGRVIAFYDGTIIADGAPEQVLKDDRVRTYVIGKELHKQVDGAGDA